MPTQIVDTNKDAAPCRHCGANLVDVANFQYMEKVDSAPTYVEEHCQCKKCKTDFILHHDLFDKNGHVYSKVFIEDINNPSINWQDSLNEDQREVISQHLKTCKVCIDRMEQEILTNAWLINFNRCLAKKFYYRLKN